MTIKSTSTLEPAAERSRLGRILIVDDEPDALTNLKDLLTDLGYLVDSACSGDEALQLAKQEWYDFALLDFRMPRMDGLELARRLVAIQPCMMTVLITAFLSIEQNAGELEAGRVRRVLSKPLDVGELIGTLQTFENIPAVLVVDDDRDLCENLRQAFEEQGYRVCTAYDFPQAVTFLQNRPFALALFDFRLPGGNGLRLVNQFQLLNPEQQVVVMTGFRNEVVDQITVQEPTRVPQICFKPLQLAELLAATKLNNDPPQTTS